MHRLILVVALLGCDGGSAQSEDLSMSVDLAIGADLRGAPIGGACAQDSDCSEGSSPVCWGRTYLNEAGNVATAGGYCSSACTSDTDCGSGICIDEGTNGKWCMAACMAPSDCRTGYACFTRIAGHCFPSGVLTCDPAADNGTCTGAGPVPGGCIRYALGSGKTGECDDGCVAGAGSCPPVGGSSRHCTVLDETRDSFGDKWEGLVCVFSGVENSIGTECVDNGKDFVDACVDGAACYLQYLGGDNLCHALCVPGAVDGGTRCATGTCTDVWGLFASSNPVGLCL